MSAGIFSVEAPGQEVDFKSMMLMPGPLIQAHAEEESRCDSCHSSFDKVAQDRLCLECHEEVDSDREQQTGFHGLSPRAMQDSCNACHSDHKGRDFDNIPLDRDGFDHRHTNFILENKHASLTCESCHQAGELYRDAPTACIDCHEKQSPHDKVLGAECDSCHLTRGWLEQKAFDHSATDFPLRGEHEAVACGACHAGERYSFETTDCVSCHRLEDVHLGRYGQDCARCHSEEGWDSRAFDHGAETDFDLKGAHSKQSCGACHLQNLLEKPPGTDCVSCHRSADVHAGRNGDSCADCHGTDNWGKTSFDHASVADWPLQGEHRDLACLQCHQGSVDEQRGAQCIDCHRDDDVHKSAAMEDCEACHGPSGWNDQQGFDHELTRFPLEGMHAISSCGDCHQNHEFRQVELTCVACHREDDAHESGLGSGCESCHSPNGWTLWSFDHAAETGFELLDAHAEISCGSCHRGKRAEDVARTCAGCHRSDDRHGGSFGENCGRCHSTRTFGDIQWTD